ncbi:hypothetical protein NDU88_001978 [Pleurodeles waltl]|uniref:Uncharacterized protein n=1 Tax=Pleurodeles waltl TaxID=8319 RepID=A0AAV7MRF8_PLEWA|nr:hypothetical protein NDU88_001978 [Pleurodeles waltl]
MDTVEARAVGVCLHCEAQARDKGGLVACLMNRPHVLAPSRLLWTYLCWAARAPRVSRLQQPRTGELPSIRCSGTKDAEPEATALPTALPTARYLSRELLPQKGETDRQKQK